MSRVFIIEKDKQYRFGGHIIFHADGTTILDSDAWIEEVEEVKPIELTDRERDWLRTMPSWLDVSGSEIEAKFDALVGKKEVPQIGGFEQTYQDEANERIKSMDDKPIKTGKVRVNAVITPNDEEWDPDAATGLTLEGENGWAFKFKALGLDNIEFTREYD